MVTPFPAPSTQVNGLFQQERIRINASQITTEAFQPGPEKQEEFAGFEEEGKGRQG
jgi:hypothetical protein